jgi:hypothetical protein
VTSEQAYQRGIQAQATEVRVDARKVECEYLAEHINWLDAAARAPQSAYGQDRLRTDKAKTQTRQFDLHC